jgi:hypothetical protein
VGDSPTHNADAWQAIMQKQKQNEFHQMMKIFRTSFVPSMIVKLYKHVGGHENFTSQCHVASASLAKVLAMNFKNMTGYPFPPTWLTFGAIYYNGINVYNVTEESVRKIINDGFSTSELNLHCWITLSDMFIVDITLLASLKQKGIISGRLSDKDAYIIQDGNLTRKFRYEPIVVSDSLITHIDKIMYTPSKII